MPLPPEMLQAVTSPGGGKLSFVIGAGCSIEAPTSVPVAWVCSKEVHRRLVEDGVIKDGDCSDPCDLSLVADTVFSKTGSQKPVVGRFSEQYDLKLAAPNAGYLILAAMLCEGAISSVVTFNFDLAMTNALSHLGVGNSIGVVDSPDDLPRRKARNVYYLHRNVNASDPETWVLRSAALETEWKGHWQSIIAGSVLASPIVVFAGLGTPISVLVETTSLIRAALPAATKYFQVDPSEKEKSKVFVALKIDDAAYLQKPWCEFMEELSKRFVSECIALLDAAMHKKVRDDRLTAEDTTALLIRLSTLGLVSLGKARAQWLLHEKPYCPDDDTGRAQLADLFLAARLIARVAHADLQIADDGLVEFHRDGRVVAVYALVSGRGHRGKAAIEAQIELRRSQFRSRSVPPLGALVGGTSDSWAMQLSPPEDVVRGPAAEDIVTGPTSLPLIHIGELRADMGRVAKVVP
ncbi:MAG: hypothetical protein HOP29_16315 [Phycisphaerales bacterium]|nr:hypothetical protein [Phycisphaerales bacterium]